MSKPTTLQYLLTCNKCGRYEDAESANASSRRSRPNWSNLAPLQFFDTEEVGGGAYRPVLLEAVCKNDGHPAVVWRV